MSLQKIVSFALPKHEDTRPSRVKPEQAQAMLIFRLASAKIWEASQAIRQNKHLAMTLRNVVLPKMPDGPMRLKALNKSINDAPWLSPLRHGMGFHFPKFEDWRSHIVPDESWVDDYVYLGEKSGNTFYEAADSIGQSWMFSQYGALNLREAVHPLISQMIQLLVEMNTFLEDVLATLIGQIMLEGQGQRRHVGKVLSPQYERVTIPFWISMPIGNE